MATFATHRGQVLPSRERVLGDGLEHRPAADRLHVEQGGPVEHLASGAVSHDDGRHAGLDGALEIFGKLDEGKAGRAPRRPFLAVMANPI